MVNFLLIGQSQLIDLQSGHLEGRLFFLVVVVMHIFRYVAITYEWSLATSEEIGVGMWFD